MDGIIDLKYYNRAFYRALTREIIIVDKSDNSNRYMRKSIKTNTKHNKTKKKETFKDEKVDQSKAGC